ncbi:MAG: hypothetical protein ACOCTO_01170 [Marinilabiliaceae bacterium]
MMKPSQIELKKERDFSDVFNAAFSFISSEAGRLFRVIALYAGVPVIIAVIMSAYYARDTMTSIFHVMNGANDMSQPDTGLVLLTILFGVVAQLFLMGLVPAYMAEYEQKGKDGFRADDVWQRFARNFGSVAGFGILSLVIIIVGFVLFLIPGIYLSVPLSFILYVLLIENKKGGALFSRCFQLVRSQWWKTFGILLLAYLILAIVSGIFSLPSAIVAGIEGFLVGSGEKEVMESNSLAVILATIFSGLGQYILYPGLYVVVAFQYYNLREQKDRESLMEKVSEIKEDE